MFVCISLRCTDMGWRHWVVGFWRTCINIFYCIVGNYSLLVIVSECAWAFFHEIFIYLFHSMIHITFKISKSCNPAVTVIDYCWWEFLLYSMDLSPMLAVHMLVCLFFKWYCLVINIIGILDIDIDYNLEFLKWTEGCPRFIQNHNEALM